MCLGVLEGIIYTSIAALLGPIVYILGRICRIERTPY